MADFLYLPDIGVFDVWDEIPAGEYAGKVPWYIRLELVKASDETFHIGDYKDEPAKMRICIKCGGNVFNVGTGSYFTAIRCVTCGWELCVHDG